MVYQILGYWVTVLSQVWLWFTQLLDASGMAGVFLVFFSATVAYRLLAVPILGQTIKAGSDTAERKKE